VGLVGTWPPTPPPRPRCAGGEEPQAGGVLRHARRAGHENQDGDACGEEGSGGRDGVPAGAPHGASLPALAACPGCCPRTSSAAGSAGTARTPDWQLLDVASREPAQLTGCGCCLPACLPALPRPPVPADQPPAGLPHLRPGRRVRPAGPGHGVWQRQEVGGAAAPVKRDARSRGAMALMHAACFGGGGARP